MTHTVTVVGRKRCTAASGETLLDALLRGGVPVRYGCRRGKCSTCKHLLIDGDVDESEISAYALLDHERDEGLTLLCKARVRGDCTVELLEPDDEYAIELSAPSVVDAEVVDAQPLGPTLWHLEIETAEPVAFQPGQYVELSIPGLGEQTRSYSIAVPPSSPSRLGFVIRRHEGGAFSGALGTGIGPGARVAVHGPYGDMYLRRSGRPVVLVGAGSGIAPLLSIVEHLAEVEPERRVRLVFGARTRGDLIIEERVERWAKIFDDFNAWLTLTSPAQEDAWGGHVGRVQSLISAAVGDEWDLDAYVCGPPQLCADASLFLEARGVPLSQIHTDGFYQAD